MGDTTLDTFGRLDTVVLNAGAPLQSSGTSLVTSKSLH